VRGVRVEDKDQHTGERQRRKGKEGQPDGLSSCEERLTSGKVPLLQVEE
jgi:hypothetical protein